MFYLVPGAQGSTEIGRRWVNWACYLPVGAEDLPDFLVDEEGKHHEHSLPPGSMRIREEDRLKRLMSEHLPSYFAEIIAQYRSQFRQESVGWVRTSACASF